ncbi:MAG: ABC transporter ATP-binding protein [Chloroflexia bacterium]|nr:ABC transporter ATP-binding protein [Chloroflexia bacterium]
MIQLRDLGYRYPESDRPTLKNIHLDVPEGEFLLVAGPSGAGKSTLLRCLNGLVPHFYGGALTGQIEVCGQNPVSAGPRQMSVHVGLVFQDPESQQVASRVEDEIAFAMENHGLPETTMRKRVEEVLDQLGLAQLRQRRLETLSGGERQRVAIAAVLTMQPRLLVLDEPTSQLDPQGAEEVLDNLLRLNRDLGLTIVLSEHRLERVVRHADRILYLRGVGQAALVGPPRQILQQVALVPPLVALGKALDWQPLPLTVREARRFIPVQDHRVEAEPPSPPVNDSEPVIQIENLSFSYNGRPALRDVQLQIQAGQIVALMGRNGSGKTTLLKQIVGLLHPQQGRVRVAGLDTRQSPLERLIEQVGYVPQNPNALLFADTVGQELDFTLRQHGRPAGDYGELPELLGLGPHMQRYPRDLSVGERQRVALAAILVGRPQIILLDEPTRGLDYEQKEALSSFLRQQRDRGRTVVLATHDVELAARCADRVVLLAEGQVLLQGPARQVMTDSLTFSPQVNRLYRDPRYLTVEDVLDD